MNRYCYLLGLAVALNFLLPSSAICADTLGGDAGELRPLPGQHPAVRLVQETVHILAYTVSSDPGYYRVTADAIFHNLGQAQRVAMCVPENDVGTGSGHSVGLADLNIRVDGRRLEVRRRLIDATSVSLPDLNALWVTDVTFGRGQTRHIRVQYRSHTWGSCGTFLTYTFSGRGWRGRVGRTEIITNAGSIYYDEGGNPVVDVKPKRPYRTWKSFDYYTWRKWRDAGAICVA